jgi:hypothetical protein
LELAGGFAREVEGAVEVAGTELAEGKFEEDAGFAEAGGSFEQNERVALEGGGEIALGGFLAWAWGGERRSETQVTEAFAGAVAERKELGDAFELAAEERVVGGGEGDGLGEAAGSFDEDELRAKTRERRARTFGGARAQQGVLRIEAPEGGVGGELDEIFRIVAAEFRFVDGQCPRDGFDFPEDQDVWKRDGRSVT